MPPSESVPVDALTKPFCGGSGRGGVLPNGGPDGHLEQVGVGARAEHGERADVCVRPVPCWGGESHGVGVVRQLRGGLLQRGRGGHMLALRCEHLLPCRFAPRSTPAGTRRPRNTSV